jgi:hypothetical protein
MEAHGQGAPLPAVVAVARTTMRERPREVDGFVRIRPAGRAGRASIDMWW